MTITNRRPRIASIVKATAPDTLKIPPFPASTLPEGMASDWRGIIRYMHERALWTETKASLVEQYLVNLAIVREAKKVLDAEGLFYAGKPHPASTVIARHSQAAAKISGLVGIGRITDKGKDADNPPRPVGRPPKTAWSA